MHLSGLPAASGGEQAAFILTSPSSPMRTYTAWHLHFRVCLLVYAQVVTAVRITGKDAAGSTAGTKAQPTTSSDDSPATSDDSAGPATQPHMTAAAKAAPAEAAAAAGAPAAAAAATAVDECRPGTGRCTICLEDWEEGAVLRRMSCTHCFHKVRTLSR